MRTQVEWLVLGNLLVKQPTLRFSPSMSAEGVWSLVLRARNLLRVILNLLLLGLVLNLTLQPLVEPDLGWHLRAGLDLVAHGWVLPDTDPYSHTMPDWRWVEHAWLTDAVIALLYRGLEPFGALGLIVLFGVVTALAWWQRQDKLKSRGPVDWALWWPASGWRYPFSALAPN